MAAIILAEDHVMVRQGLKRIIEEAPDFKVIHEAGNGLELLEFLAQSKPDIVILDVSMPRLGGLEAAQKIKQLYPGVKILILTMHQDKHYFSKAQEIGVDGYLLKEDADTDLNSAIYTILQGNTYTSPLLR
ncbi:MAG: response regulator transcription factor [Desulfobaccales bacterium]